MQASISLRGLAPLLFFAMVVSQHSQGWAADPVAFDAVANSLRD